MKEQEAGDDQRKHGSKFMIACPMCGSGDVFSCPAAYEHGTSHTTYNAEATARSAEIGYDPNQVRASGSGNVTSQTAFAKRASPPSTGLAQGPAVVLLAILLLIPGYLFLRNTEFDSRAWDIFLVVAGFIPNANELIDLEYDPGKGVFVVAGLIAALGVLVLVYRILTLPIWFVRLLRWKRSWICVRCSAIFVPVSA